jgi:radical SAM superfamily enzyme YgiQ (UPF0313 family)
LLVYPEFPDTFWSYRHVLPFIHKKAMLPPLGLLTVAAMLPEKWEKHLVDLNVQPLHQHDLDWADYVFISAMIVQRETTKAVIKRCKEAGKRIVAGGPLFLSEHESFPEVDHFVLNEGEVTLPPFIRDLEAGNPSRIYSSNEFPDITLSPAPLWSLAKLDLYSDMCLQYSRGCPFACDFCNITSMLGHKPRTKTARQIVTELDALYQAGWRGRAFFVDDNFIGNKRKLKEEVLPAIIEWRKGKKGMSFSTEASINLADDPELMHLMGQAGFNSVFVGIETPDDAGLNECQKNQNRGRDLVESVKTLQRNGFNVDGGFIVGFDSDNESIFQRQIDFIQRSGIVMAMVGLLQAPKGTSLYDRMKDEGRLICETTGNNADDTINFVPKMDSDLLHRGYQKILATIYAPKVYYQRVRTFLREYHIPTPIKTSLTWSEIRAFLRSIVVIGFGHERREYWKLLLWTIFHRPKLFAEAVTCTVLGFHCRRISEMYVSSRNQA